MKELCQKEKGHEKPWILLPRTHNILPQVLLLKPKNHENTIQFIAQMVNIIGNRKKQGNHWIKSSKGYHLMKV